MRRINTECSLIRVTTLCQAENILIQKFMAVEKYVLKMCINNADNFKIFNLSRRAKTITTSRTTSSPISLI